MNIIANNRLKNNIVDCLLNYFERKIVKNLDINSIIDEFYDLKQRFTQL